MDLTDGELADAAIRDWVDPAATRTPLTAMNSSAWLVEAGADRYVLKISSASEEPAMRVAAWLDAHGLRTGAPIRVAVRGERLVALLEFVDGRALADAPGDAMLVGETLGTAHALLVDAPVPPGIDPWPWSWPDAARIEEPDLRAAAVAAIAEAHRLAPTLTHGILHGDPAPEAFLATSSGVALIDWGAACHGPLLYDVASARMYAGPDVLAAYVRTAPVEPGELAAVPVFLAFRWAVQAWYFADRIRRHDVTGLGGGADNEQGLADARRALLARP
jgi:homoserine kinase type II